MLIKKITSLMVLLLSLAPTFAQQELPFVGKIAYNLYAGQLHILNLETGETQRFVRRETWDLMVAPYWNSEGTLIVSEGSLSLLDPLTDQRTRLRRNAIFPSWHPNENKIIYTARYEGIGILDFDTGEEIIIPLPLRVLYPSWHPLQNKIIFTGDSKSTDRQTYTLDLACVDRSDCSDSIHEILANVPQRQPSWNSTGDYILLVQEISVEEYIVVVTDSVGNMLRNLTPSGFRDLDPKWGPCDRYVILTRSRIDEPPPNVLIIDLLTNETIQVTTEEGGGNPAWWWDRNAVDCEPFDIRQGAN
jgi:hypothetical protein